MAGPSPKVFLYPQARKALQRIHKYSRQEWGPAQAAKYVTGFRLHFERLEEREKLGLNRPWRPGSEVFRSRYEQHLVFYRHRGRDFEIGLIVHGSQDFAREVESFERS